MPSLHTAGSTGEFVRGSAPVAVAPPFTIYALIRPGTLPASTLSFGGLFDASAFSDSYVFRATSGAKLRFTARDTTDSHADTVNAMTAGTWHHCVFRATATNNRDVILDADFANKGTSTAAKSITGANIDRVSFGKRDNAANDQPADAFFFYAAMWDVALSDADITRLASGKPPRSVSPRDMVHFWERFGGLPSGAAVLDAVGGVPLAITGATSSDQSPVVQPFVMPRGVKAFAATQRKLKSRVSVADVFESTTGLVFPDRPVSFVVRHDDVANTLEMVLDNGSRATLALSGAANAQTGDAAIGAGLDVGAVVDSTTAQLGISDFMIVERAVDSIEEEQILSQLADNLRPVTTNSTLNMTPNSSVVMSLISLVDDRGQGWQVISATSSNGRTIPTITGTQEVTFQSLDAGAEIDPVGTDDVTIVVQNQNPRPRAATLVIAVTVNNLTYLNGYSFQNTLTAPRQFVVGGSTDGLVARFNITNLDLRDVANGGDVESPAGDDIRFEDRNNVKLPHHIRSYDPATGNLDVNVRLRTWDPSLENFRVHMFYGNAAVTTSEQDINGTWSGELASWDARTGVDYSPAGHHLSPTGITAGTLIGDAGDYDGSAVATLANDDFLEGVQNTTFRFWVHADVGTLGTDRGIFSQGNITGADVDQGVTIRYDAVGFNGGAASTIMAEVNTSDGARPRIEGTAELQSSEPQHIAVTLQQGQPLKMFVNGVAVAATNVQNAVVAGISTPEGDIYLGAASQDSASGGWDGLIDEPRISDGALSQAWIQAERLSQLRAATWFGINGQNVPGVPLKPIAGPIFLETQEGVAVAVDALNWVEDPAGGTLTVSAVGTASNGTTSIPVAGQVRYQPNASFVGDDSFTYTVTNGTDTDVATVYASVIGEPDANVDFLDITTPLTEDIVTPSNIVSKALNAPAGRLLRMRGGDVGSYIDLTIRAPNGTPTNPVTFVPFDIDEIPDFFGTTIFQGKNIEFFGASFDNQNYNANVGHRTIRIEGPNITLAYCDIQPVSMGVEMRNSLATDMRIHRCHFHNQGAGGSGNGGEAVKAGLNALGGVSMRAYIDYCLIEGFLIERETISFKSDDNTVYRCHLINCRNISYRFGNRNSVIECRHDEKITVSDLGGKVIGCIADEIEVWNGGQIAEADTPPDYHQAKNVELANNTVRNLLIGVTPFNDPDNGAFVATNTKLDSNTVTGTFSDNGVNTQTLNLGYVSASPPILTASVVGPRAMIGKVQGFPGTGTPPETVFSTPTGNWKSNDFLPLPTGIGTLELVNADDRLLLDQARLTANNSSVEETPGSWGGGFDVFPARRHTIGTFLGKPVVVHSVRLINGDGVPDTIGDFRCEMPPNPGDLSRFVSLPYAFDPLVHDTILLRWHFAANSYRGTNNGGKRILLNVGRGNISGGDFVYTSGEAHGSTDGTGFNSMAPTISDPGVNQTGFGTLVDHISAGTDVTDQTFGDSVNGTVVPYQLNQFIVVDQILKLNTPGNSDGFWRLDINGATQASRTNVKFSNDPLGMKALGFLIRNMSGGNPQDAISEPDTDFDEYLGGSFLFVSKSP